MKLNGLLRREEWTEEKLAAALRKRGFHRAAQSTINRLRNRKRKASLEFALALEDAVGGLVTAEELPLSKRTRKALRGVRDLSRLTPSKSGEAA